jgi:hypothetical protein
MQESKSLKNENHPPDKGFPEKKNQRLVFESEAVYSNIKKFSSDVKNSSVE